MAGNREVYEQALNQGANFAWEQNWDGAIGAYTRALAEFPEDQAALSGIGLAYSGAGQLEDAIDAYHKATQLNAADPSLPERMAKALEQLGRPEEAANAYAQAADRYVAQGTPNLALARWQDAVSAYHNHIPSHVRILQAYLSQQRKEEALTQYLVLAEVYHNNGQRDKAMELLQYALRMSPRNPDIMAMMDHLRYNEKEIAIAPPGTGSLEPTTLGFDIGDDDEYGEDTGSPVEIALRKALTDLAETVFSEALPKTGPLVMRELSKPEIDAHIAKALDAQTRGNVEDAIASYEHVLKAGVIQSAVNFNLGLLYQQQLRFEEAIEQFEKAVEDPEYRLGSHFALGECQRARGRIDEALKHFIEVLKIVDMATVQREQVDDLIQLYGELARTYAAKGERDQAVEFLNSLIGFLGDKGWEDKVTQARERLNGVAHAGPILSLAEMLSVQAPESILESLGLAQEYMRRGLEDAAQDELDHAILLAPTYLPIHRQMGEVLLSLGKAEAAVAKFVTIADLYHVRGNFSQAAAMYERALSLAPMNITLRAKLIDLLVTHGEIDRALEQYLALADTYYQMAQLDRAREKYNEALQLAPRGDPEHRWAVRILHRIGDIDIQRVDWRRAMSVYEEIRSTAPDDEKARLTLVDLYYRFGQSAQAIGEIDGLVQALRESGKSQKIIPVLEQIALDHDRDIPIRTRLTQAYLNARDIEGALKQLDTLGDLQLEAGRTQDAIKTIQMILRLNPPNPEPYQALLAQLTE
ncbi:MAG: tetratricopeptide repeat protein [Anaerolineae bacterium]|nr:tetratricopeptide repeat protein [Anaerolineae bacterium]